MPAAMTRQAALARIQALTANTSDRTEFVPVEALKVGDALTGLWDRKCPIVKVRVFTRRRIVQVTTFSSYSRGNSVTEYAFGDALYTFRSN